MQDLLIEIQDEPEAPVKDEACMLEANFKGVESFHSCALVLMLTIIVPA